jgi:hypothetical protein
MSEPQHCETCRYWVLVLVDHSYGDCRRYPPTVLAEGATCCWPTTEADTGCGEWKPKEPIHGAIPESVNAVR